MNVRLTIDVPVRHLTGLEAALAARGLAIRPYVKAGAFRWQLAPRPQGDRDPSVPGTLVATPVEEVTL